MVRGEKEAVNSKGEEERKERMVVRKEKGKGKRRIKWERKKKERMILYMVRKERKKKNGAIGIKGEEEEE